MPRSARTTASRVANPASRRRISLVPRPSADRTPRPRLPAEQRVVHVAGHHQCSTASPATLGRCPRTQLAQCAAARGQLGTVGVEQPRARGPAAMPAPPSVQALPPRPSTILLAPTVHGGADQLAGAEAGRGERRASPRRAAGAGRRPRPARPRGAAAHGVPGADRVARSARSTVDDPRSKPAAHGGVDRAFAAVGHRHRTHAQCPAGPAAGPAAMCAATSAAVSDPLNLSGASTTCGSVMSRTYSRWPKNRSATPRN